jgi:RNA polymerase sigma-70 factor (ECF subfamily)
VPSLPAPEGSDPEPIDAAAAADQDLIRSFRAGGASADSALAARFAIVPRILAGLCRRLGYPVPAHDLDDLAQDAMLVALRKIDQVRPGVPLDAWLHRVCNYELANWLRRRRRQANDALPPDLAGSEATLAEQLERRELLFAALEQLSPGDARIVHLHLVEGHTMPEIARTLGCTENTVKGRYYRAIVRLGSILRKHRPGAEEP